MQITTRRATLADVVTISELAQQTFYDTFTGTCTEEDMQSFLDSYFSLQQVESELTNENDFFFIAETDGQAVGYLRFMEDYNNFPEMKKWRALELKRIYVSKEFFGKGVAQVLMDFILQYASQHKYEVVWLGVWEHNLRAQKFYEKYGFVKSGYTHDFPIGNTPQTDCWFWKFL